jgi:glutamyl-Q tRNA(Asp) synthetase
LGAPTPSYLHVPVVSNAQGEKLSKQTGASALDIAQPLSELMEAARFLNLHVEGADSIAHFWKQAIAGWRQRFVLR